MRIGIPKERLDNETRVAATPKTVKQLLELGFSVAIESRAGKLANFDDEEYIEAGAEIVKSTDVWQQDIILKVNPPEEKEILLLNNKAILVSFLWPSKNLKLIEKLAARGITAIAIDSVPRISRAQSIDALSSMANIAGYRAVIEAANEFGRFFVGQVTGAGKILPAKVMVIGAGVAGLSAISTANSLGAIVRAFDIRPEVKEQVQSVGAEFLQLNLKKEVGVESNSTRINSKLITQAEVELLNSQIKEIDIVIATALIPGKRAPKLITREMVNSMKAGSVIVDLAAQNGGNCEYTITNQIVKTNNGVKVIGYTDLVSRLPTQASHLYSTNLLNLLKFLCRKRDGMIIIDFNDIIDRSITVIRNGEITWPAPPIPISSHSEKMIKVEKIEKKTSASQKLENLVSPWYKYIFTALLTILFFYLAAISPKEFLNHFTVFSLSCIVGYYVIWNVSNTLHTILISVTNAISGIIIIGALLQINQGGLISVLSFISILIASIDIFGGFSITHRVLKMFYKG